jgi:hypothetical protein
VPQGSKFVRKGAPDAGVECYWTLPHGDEWTWQAKFFTSPPDTSQWRQIDHSVETALDKHPRMSMLTVCLPLDRQDPRIELQRWFMDAWDEHVQKWAGWAQDKQMSVEFSYWGDHEIWERLSREDHRGRHFFWFNEEYLSHRWFENLAEETISDVGPRYTPELNVALPISELFDGLGRTSEFFAYTATLYGETLRAFRVVGRLETEDEGENELIALRESMEQLLSKMEDVKEGNEIAPIEWSSIADLAARSRGHAIGFGDALATVAEEDDAHPSSRPAKGTVKSA